MEMRVQITKQEENGYSWLVETNEVIDNVETLVRFLEEQRKDYDYNEDTRELFADPKDCTAMDGIAAHEWNN